MVLVLLLIKAVQVNSFLVVRFGRKHKSIDLLLGQGQIQLFNTELALWVDNNFKQMQIVNPSFIFIINAFSEEEGMSFLNIN